MYLIILFIIAYLFESETHIFSSNTYAKLLLMLMVSLTIIYNIKEKFVPVASTMPNVQSVGTIYNRGSATVTNLTVSGTLKCKKNAVLSTISTPTITTSGNVSIGGTGTMNGSLRAGATNITGDIGITGTTDLGGTITAGTVDLRQFAIACILYNMDPRDYDGVKHNGFLSAPYYFTVGSYNMSNTRPDGSFYGDDPKNDSLDVVVLNPGFGIDLWVGWNGNMDTSQSSQNVQTITNTTTAPTRTNIIAANTISSIKVYAL